MQTAIAPDLGGGDGFYSYSGFKTESVLGRKDVNLDIIAPKTELFNWTPNSKFVHFLQNCCNDVDYI
jgi:hypothetical protein